MYYRQFNKKERDDFRIILTLASGHVAIDDVVSSHINGLRAVVFEGKKRLSDTEVDKWKVEGQNWLSKASSSLR